MLKMRTIQILSQLGPLSALIILIALYSQARELPLLEEVEVASFLQMVRQVPVSLCQVTDRKSRFTFLFLERLIGFSSLMHVSLTIWKRKGGVKQMAGFQLAHLRILEDANVRMGISYSGFAQGHKNLEHFRGSPIGPVNTYNVWSSAICHKFLLIKTCERFFKLI